MLPTVRPGYELGYVSHSYAYLHVYNDVARGMKKDGAYAVYVS